jgi:protein-L-isoaspartate(D-aspartate) O-methyltransferase
MKTVNAVPGLLAASCIAATSGAQDFGAERAALVAERAALVAEIERDIAATRPAGKSELDQRVVQALAHVPRHRFVPASLQDLAYQDTPLPIGNDQTISQPYIVALMTELAEIDNADVVLEIGTGSGYQAAVLAEIAREVYTIEIIEPLGRGAMRVLEVLGYDNVTVRIGDGYAGWPEKAPFDAILVTAAPEVVPPALIEQLKPGGRLVVPVGADYATQILSVIEKTPTGELTTTDVLPVRFVPFLRDE